MGHCTGPTQKTSDLPSKNINVNLNLNLNLKNYNTVISFPDHNLTFKDILRTLHIQIIEALQLLCSVIKPNEAKNIIKIIIMNIAGNCTLDIIEATLFMSAHSYYSLKSVKMIPVWLDSSSPKCTFYG
jgi:hypothetical protein